MVLVEILRTLYRLGILQQRRLPPPVDPTGRFGDRSPMPNLRSHEVSIAEQRTRERTRHRSPARSQQGRCETEPAEYLRNHQSRVLVGFLTLSPIASHS